MMLQTLARLRHRVIQRLVQDVVLPSAGDLEIGRRRTEPYEAVTFENALRADVVPQCPGLDAVETERPEGKVDSFPHGGGAETPAVVLRVHPIAKVAGLERATHDVAERHATDDTAV